MSRPLAAIEHFIERLVERPAARIFRTHVEPIQVQRRLERAMDEGLDRRTGHVPDTYRVRLHPADAAALEPVREALEAELSAELLRYARQGHRRLAARPSVTIVADPTVTEGEIVVAGWEGGDAGRLQAGGRLSAAGRVDRVPSPDRGDADGGEGSAGSSADAAERPAGSAGARLVSAGASPGPADAPAAGQLAPEAAGDAGGRAGASAPAVQAGHRSIREAPSRPRRTPVPASGPAPAAERRTAAFPVPAPRVPTARVLVRVPGAQPREFTLQAANVRVGRSADNDLILADGRVSRHHARLTARQGALVYADLGSTNGSLVNGERVLEVALGPGDVVQLGDSTLTVLAEE